MSQISIITTPAPVSAGVDSITGNTGGALTGALNLVGASGSGLTVDGAGTTLTINQTAVAFSAYNNTPVANVTGNGTVYTCTFDTELYDSAGAFAGGTTFTAPVTGIYNFSVVATFTGIVAAKTSSSLRFLAAGASYVLYSLDSPSLDVSGTFTLSASLDISLTAGQTCVAQIYTFGGDGLTNTGWGGGTAPYVCVFSGHLVR